jgi:hypothetical protein
LGFCLFDPLPQGSSWLATLGFVAESHWDSGKRHLLNRDLRPDEILRSTFAVSDYCSKEFIGVAIASSP